MKFTGVGDKVDMEELRGMASSEANIYSVYDYSSLNKLRDVISRTTCLGICVTIPLATGLRIGQNLSIYLCYYSYITKTRTELV